MPQALVVSQLDIGTELFFIISGNAEMLLTKARAEALAKDACSRVGGDTNNSNGQSHRTAAKGLR